jgi:hypothetical protein
LFRWGSNGTRRALPPRGISVSRQHIANANSQLDAENQPADPARDIMKKKPSQDDLKPHYDFDYDKLKPNRFAGEKKVYKQTFIVLDEDVSKVFQSSEEVNVLLRSAIRAMRAAAPRLRRKRRAL